jgi:hypothetical protein
MSAAKAGPSLPSRRGPIYWLMRVKRVPAGFIMPAIHDGWRVLGDQMDDTT